MVKKIIKPAARKPAPVSYEEPVLEPAAAAALPALDIISECYAQGPHGRVGRETAQRILALLEAAGYTVDHSG